MIIRTIVAAGIGWGALYAAQNYYLKTITAQIAQGPALQLPAPAFPTMAIDTSKMITAINPPVVIDTKKYERLAIESMVREMDQRNRAALSHVPVPPYIPGMRH